MLKVIQAGNGIPLSYNVDSSSTFQPGQIGQMKIVGQEVVVGLSDGTAPLGIIDDIRSNAFTQTIYDEIVIIRGVNVQTDGYNFYTGDEANQHLANAGIVQSSFIADYDGLILNSVNGIVTLPANSVLNWDLDNDGLNDSVKTIVNYVYNVPNLPGDDTTIGSNRVTIWFQRGLFSTDQFDTLLSYPINATLFVNESGILTTRQLTENHPGVGMVTGPPSASDSTIEFMWL
jgi:hypothetical protein